jgi:hypothetical protein
MQGPEIHWSCLPYLTKRGISLTGIKQTIIPLKFQGLSSSWLTLFQEFHNNLRFLHLFPKFVIPSALPFTLSTSMYLHSSSDGGYLEVTLTLYKRGKQCQFKPKLATGTE